MLSGITWRYTAQKSRNGKLIKKSQDTRGQTKTTTKFVLKIMCKFRAFPARKIAQ